MERLNDEMVHLSVAQGGKVVKSTGDGILAVFPTPSGALNAAADMVAVAQELGLGLRVGGPCR